MSQQDTTDIKSLSRFVEHFDLMLPTELLDIIGEEEQAEKQHQKDKLVPKSAKLTKKQITPLSSLPEFNKYSSSTTKQPYIYSAVLPNKDKRMNIKHYDRNSFTQVKSSPNIDENGIQLLARSQSSPSVPIPNNSIEGAVSTLKLQSSNNKPQNRGSPPAISTLNSFNESGLNEITEPNNAEQQQYQNISSRGRSAKNILRGSRSMNRAEFIINRYESWIKFIGLLCSWISEITRLSVQSERSYQSVLKDGIFSNLRGSKIETANGIHASMHVFTLNLALQEQKFGQSLQTEHLPILEKLKKESSSRIKHLKSRQDLNLEEFLKRAEVTVSLISQLTKTCKEARRTIERGTQLVNDPWLVNLYVLRQLKQEVDEENRLRRLMVPIQQSMLEFENRLFEAIENALTVCYKKPGALDQDQLDDIQTSLNNAISNSWESFAANNKADIVNERNPLKNYLNINYPHKNDQLLLTLHKGRLERRTGVLNKYAHRFFVLTESGYLHQFKLNDKVSPEFSIYLPKCTIIPCIDISSLDLLDEEHHIQQEKPGKEGFTFEVQRSTTSVLQRDRSYVFRAFSLQEMVIWCRLLSDVATRSPDYLSKYDFNSTEKPSSQSITSPSSSSISLQNKQQQHDESTPPPSPVAPHENRKSILSVVNDARKSQDISGNDANEYRVDYNDNNINAKPKAYAPQLNL